MSNKLLQRRRQSQGQSETNSDDALPSSDQAWSTQVNLNLDVEAPTETNGHTRTHVIKRNGKSIPNMRNNKSSIEDYIKNTATTTVTPTTSATKDKPATLSRQKSTKLSLREMLFSWRYLIVLLLHFSFVVAIQVRNVMSMAMVCMVDQSSAEDDSNDTVIYRNGSFQNSSISFWNNVTQDSENGTSGNPIVTGNEYEFRWDNELQGLILTAISFCSFLGPLVTDFLRLHIGNKWTLTMMSTLTAVLNLVTPMAARSSPYLLMAVRVALGVVVLANLPIAGDTCAWWGPAAEKQVMISVIFGGVNVGGIISSSLTGLLCEIPYDNGWPFVFYFFGGVTLLWTIAWHFFSSQKPEEHPFVSEKEKEYIIAHRPAMQVKENMKAEKPPYGTILTSVPVLAFLFSSSCHVWTSNVYFTNLPFFFSIALGSSVLETGLLMSIISTVRFAGLVVWTAIVNVMIRRNVPVTVARKAVICTGFGLSAIGQAIIVFLDRDQKWTIFGILLFIMVNQCVGSCVVPVLPQDMAPKYAGFLTGLFFSLGSFVSISGPLLVAAVTPTGTIEEWRIVWVVIAVIFLLASLVFALFGDARLQPWAVEDPRNKTRVVSTFVAMSRRFSALFHTSPLTPGSPVQGEPFDFTQSVPDPTLQGKLNGQVSHDEDPLQDKSFDNLKMALKDIDDDDDSDNDVGIVVSRETRHRSDFDDDHSNESAINYAAQEAVSLSINSALESLDKDADAVDIERTNNANVLDVQQLSSVQDFGGGYLNEACNNSDDEEVAPTVLNAEMAVSSTSVVTRL